LKATVAFSTLPGALSVDVRRGLPTLSRGRNRESALAAATAVGTGVVATGNGEVVSLRTQVNGEYVYTEQTASADVDRAQSADGAAGVAYEYANPDGKLYFYQQDGDLSLTPS
jgi:hypothetical protein